MPETPLRQTGELCASAAGAATSAARRLNERLDEVIGAFMRELLGAATQMLSLMHNDRSQPSFLTAKVRMPESG